MLIDRDHNFPVVTGSNGHRDRAELDDILDDIATFPDADPLLQLKSDEQLEGAWRTALWILDAVPRDGIVVKILALRYLFGIEPLSMAKVAKKYNVTRAAISKQANLLADSLRIPHLRSATSRENYRRAQLRAWQKRKEKYDGTN